MRRPILGLLLALALPALAAAEGVKLYEADASFEDAAFAVESAIVNQGLVIDYVSHVGAMLNRTREDVGSDRTLFANADVFLFCSAVVSREVMEADPDNIAYCPYSVFVTEAGDGSGTVRIGYRTMPAGPMQKVEALLDAIAREAAGQ